MSLFVVLEGVNHTGKSTLIKLLEAELSKIPLRFVTTVEPGKTVIGQEIRTFLLHSQQTILPGTEFLLFLASRYENFHKFIQPQLQKVDVVICDRYFYSTFVYQSYLKGLEWTHIFAGHKQLGLFERLPDIVFFVQTKPETLFQRCQNVQNKTKQFNRFHNQCGDVQYFAKMQQFYQATFAKLPPHFQQLEVVDTNTPAPVLAKRMSQIIANKLQQKLSALHSLSKQQR